MLRIWRTSNITFFREQKYAYIWKFLTNLSPNQFFQISIFQIGG